MRYRTYRAPSTQASTRDPIDSILDAADLNWMILRAPIRYTPSPADKLQEVEVDGFQVLYRSDNGQQLAMASARLVPWQPREVIDFYLSVASFYGLAIESIGYVQGGRKLWALLNTGYAETFARDRSASTHLLLSTACDIPLAAQATALCLLNPGGLGTPAAVGAQTIVRIPRSPEFLTPSDLAEIGELMRESITFPAFLKDLAEKPVTETHIRCATAAAFGTRNDDPSTPSAKSLRNVLALLREGNKRASSRATGLDVLYAIASISDARERRRVPNDFVQSNWFGVGAKRKQRAIQVLARLLTPYD
jgi:hypothetical protein